MTRRGLALASALVLLATVAAAKPLTEDQIDQFKVGVATTADVVKGLGEPRSSSSSSDGLTLLTYSSSKIGIKAATFVPYVGLFAGGAKGSTQTVVFTFGPDGLLQRVSRESTAVNCSTSIIGAHC
jgi:hypothetical protein